MYVSQPLDTVKVKMQAFPTVYKGMMDCLAQTFKKDGVVRGLYAGTLPSIAANVAENSVLFVGNNQNTIDYLIHVQRNSNGICLLSIHVFLGG